MQTNVGAVCRSRCKGVHVIARRGVVVVTRSQPDRVRQNSTESSPGLQEVKIRIPVFVFLSPVYWRAKRTT